MIRQFSTIWGHCMSALSVDVLHDQTSEVHRSDRQAGKLYMQHGKKASGRKSDSGRISPIRCSNQALYLLARHLCGSEDACFCRDHAP